MKKELLYFIVCVLMLSGCYYDNEEELYEYYYLQNTCDTDSLTYVDDVQTIVTTKCATTGCHVNGGSGNGVFESYQGVKDKVNNGSVFNRVIINQDMPPSGPLSSCEMQQIEAWINRGAPEN